MFNFLKNYRKKRSEEKEKKFFKTLQEQFDSEYPTPERKRVGLENALDYHDVVVLTTDILSQNLKQGTTCVIDNIYLTDGQIEYTVIKYSTNSAGFELKLVPHSAVKKKLPRTGGSSPGRPPLVGLDTAELTENLQDDF